MKVKCQFGSSKCIKFSDGSPDSVCKNKVVSHEFDMYLCQRHLDFINDMKWYEQNKDQIKNIVDYLFDNNRPKKDEYTT